MNFYSLKNEFREYLISQGVITSLEADEKNFDSVSIFTYSEEFRDFIDEQYNIELDENYSDLSELYEADVEDGKFVLSEESENDKETAFMADIVNGLIEDDEFVENIDDYLSQDEQDNSILLSLNNLLKDKGLIDESDNDNSDVAPIESSNPSSSTSPTPAPTPNGNYDKTPAPLVDSPDKNYSQMNVDELEQAHNAQQTSVSSKAQNIATVTTENEANIASAKEEYDKAISEDNIDPAILQNREQNLNDITQTDNLINELTANIASFDADITNLTSQISVIDGNISSLNSSLTSLASAPLDDEKAQSAIETKRAQIQSQISQLNTQKETLTTQKGQLETQKAEAETSLSENTTKLQDLEAAKSAIEAQILETCNENTKIALENYNNARNTAQANLQNAKTELDNAKSELQNIETHLKTAKAKEIEDEYSYKDKPDIFSDNEGYSLTKGEGNTRMSYSVITPNNLNPDEKAAVMLYLHGGGGSERSLQSQIMNNYNLQQGFNGYIICPTANRSDWTKDTVAQDIDQILTEFSKTHNIDPDNVVVVGHSMGGTGALHLADNEIFKDSTGIKFSRAAAITGYPDEQKDYDIPVALWADGTSEYALKNHLLNPDSDDRYYDFVGTKHENMDTVAFTYDADGDGRADLFEWLFDEE